MTRATSPRDNDTYRLPEEQQAWTTAGLPGPHHYAVKPAGNPPSPPDRTRDQAVVPYQAAVLSCMPGADGSRLGDIGTDERQDVGRCQRRAASGQCRLPYAPQGHRQSLQAPAYTSGHRAGDLPGVPLACRPWCRHDRVRKAANSALTAHDHESAAERAPALRSPARPGGASGAHGVIDDAAIPEVSGIVPRRRSCAHFPVMVVIWEVAGDGERRGRVAAREHWPQESRRSRGRSGGVELLSVVDVAPTTSTTLNNCAGLPAGVKRPSCSRAAGTASRRHRGWSAPRCQ